MKVGFKSQELKLLCSSQAALDRKFGRDVAALIRGRLSEAASVPTLADLMALPSLSYKVSHHHGRLGIVIAVAEGIQLVMTPVEDGIREFEPAAIRRVAVTQITRS